MLLHIWLLVKSFPTVLTRVGPGVTSQRETYSPQISLFLHNNRRFFKICQHCPVSSVKILYSARMCLDREYTHYNADIFVFKLKILKQGPLECRFCTYYLELAIVQYTVCRVCRADCNVVVIGIFVTLNVNLHNG
jgi:hypothetical protein